LQRLIEDHLYFIGVWSRWVDPAGWRSFGPALFGSLPPPLRLVIAAFVRRRVRASLHAQGLGRHSQAELYAMGRADLEAISVALHERPFFFGEHPTAIDAIAYGGLDTLLNVPVESELKRSAQGFPNLPAYCARMAAHLDAI
jgi:glutathione S-transferase